MRYSLFFLLLVFVTGCGEYNKVLKSNDPDYKFSKAVEYYEADECFKALPIFEELIGITRGTERQEDVYYYYAHTHYCIGDYYLANYYFKTFHKTYSKSARAEECLFMAALCSSNLSPKPSLDQRDTKAAIDEFQIFLSKYPNSEKRDTCNLIVSDLNMKLELKAMDICRLYVQTEKYKAAVIALNQLLKDFPGTTFTEEAMFLMVQSNYLYAINSVESKMFERLEETTKSYYNFVARFPQSKYSRQAEKYFNDALQEMEKLNVANN